MPIGENKLNKRIIAIVVSALLLLIMCINTSSASLSDAQKYMYDIKDMLGIEEEVQVVIITDGFTVNDLGGNMNAKSWTIVGDTRHIFINAFNFPTQDFAYAIGHEMTHIKQNLDGTIRPQDYLAYQSGAYDDNYISIPNEQEADMFGKFYSAYVDIKLLGRK